jgi:hypothetical protein
MLIQRKVTNLDPKYLGGASGCAEVLCLRGTLRNLGNREMQKSIRRSCGHKGACILWIFLTFAVAGCDRRTWEQSLDNPTLGPQDLFAKLIIATALAVTEEDTQPPTKFDFTCNAIGYTSLFEPDEVISLGSFSVVSPSSGDWCIQSLDNDRVAYVTHPWMGQTFNEKPDRLKLKNTYALAAGQIKAQPQDVESAGGIMAFAEKWIENGSEIRMADGEVIADFRQPSRFTVMSYDLSDRQVQGSDCINYQYEIEERDNPGAADLVFILHAVGVLCADPAAQSSLIGLNFSERHVRGNQVHTSLFDEMQSDIADPFFDSFKILSNETS